jgi:hypothetical protein
MPLHARAPVAFEKRPGAHGAHAVPAFWSSSKCPGAHRWLPAHDTVAPCSRRPPASSSSIGSAVPAPVDRAGWPIDIAALAIALCAISPMMAMMNSCWVRFVTVAQDLPRRDRAPMATRSWYPVLSSPPPGRTRTVPTCYGGGTRTVPTCYGGGTRTVPTCYGGTLVPETTLTHLLPHVRCWRCQAWLANARREDENAPRRARGSAA